MNRLEYYTVLLLLLLLTPFNIIAQSPNTYPEVGKPCPDFNLKDVVNSQTKTLTLKDLKGQYFILDFWSRWCIACVASFPKMNHYQEQSNGKLKVILVGLDDPAIRPLFERVRKKYDLKLTCAFDVPIHKSFGVSSVPHLVWVDANGIVKAITASEPVNQENLDKFINDVPMNLPQKSNSRQAVADRLAYDSNKPILINGNGGIDTTFLYRSLLCKWTRKMPVIIQHQFLANRKTLNKVFVSGSPLSLLYKLAYNTDSISSFPSFDNKPNSYGHYWYYPILEMADTSLFCPRYEYEENLFTYSLIVNDKKTNRIEIQKQMQRDLFSYFGYQVRVETRKMPYWRLVKSKGFENLKTKGQQISTLGDGLSYVRYTNTPANMLINILEAHNQEGAPFIDETNLPWNIDISFNAVLSDFNDLKHALKEKGLDLVKGEKDTQVIIISDQKHPIRDVYNESSNVPAKQKNKDLEPTSLRALPFGSLEHKN
ncbi:thiol-disulfide isomerase/thioredoxin [Pedobacter cryoconitis]|uniref:TlpA family protein disulfide reductase n=1 Tax=Pedobacter cryoconitis TaxID=188932 RepID=UPI00160EC49B|nr:TlpA disulfide reductase family protein [Pedobacter cryoconitis]MBB6271867.1 thiol-disulfide isomerase/thioredoxin [Pedobacter cryoconitis]